MDIKKTNKIFFTTQRYDMDEILTAAFLRQLNSGVQVEHTICSAAEREKNKRENIKLSDTHFANVWSEYGRHILEQKHFADFERAFDIVKTYLIDKINHSIEDEGQIIGESVLMSFMYGVDGENKERQFGKAVNLATMMMDNWLRLLYEEVEMRRVENDIWDMAESQSQDGIVILESNIPWHYQINRKPDSGVRIVISKSNRGGYNVFTKDKFKMKIKDSEYLTYRHPSGYMGVAKNLNYAIMAARKTLGLDV